MSSAIISHVFSLDLFNEVERLASALQLIVMQ